MKTSFFFISVLVLIAGCTVSYNSGNINNQGGLEVQESAFVVSSPVSIFSSSDIARLNVSCSGSDLNRALCIKTWEEDNIDYCTPFSGPIDCTDPIRFNYAFPGLYPSLDIINNKLSNNRVYGVCFDYAVVYCSIADYYNLTCRVVNSLTKPSERQNYQGGPTTGMSPEEYNRLKIVLNSKGYDYSYDYARALFEETPEHYWPEVLINGVWNEMDASNAATGGNVTAEYIITNNFEITNWDLRDPILRAGE